MPSNKVWVHNQSLPALISEALNAVEESDSFSEIMEVMREMEAELDAAGERKEQLLGLLICSMAIIADRNGVLLSRCVDKYIELLREEKNA